MLACPADGHSDSVPSRVVPVEKGSDRCAMNLELLGQLLDRLPKMVGGEELHDISLAEAVLSLPGTTGRFACSL
jgi:hypothetical protein